MSSGRDIVRRVLTAARAQRPLLSAARRAPQVASTRRRLEDLRTKTLIRSAGDADRAVERIIDDAFAEAGISDVP